MTLEAIVSLGSALATAIGVLVACVTIYLNTVRAKRELAVKLLNDWSVDYNLSMKHAFELAKVLSESHIAGIHNQNQSQIPFNETNKQYVSYILGQSCDWQPDNSLRTVNHDNGQITLTEAQCTTIDFKWMQMLHRLEAILLAWESGAADKKMMEKQFNPLITHNKNTFSRLVETRGIGEFPIMSGFLNNTVSR